MATRSDSPQVATLLKEVEEEFEHPVRTPSDFILLADCIETKTREHISDSTIKRLWVPSLAYETISDRTLDVLSRYVGYGHYGAFLESLAARGIKESEVVVAKDAVKAEDLSVGDVVVIAWIPDRECRLKYLGGRKFEAVECHNSYIREGDTLFCSYFARGRVLYADNLTHSDEVHDVYLMGKGHGLTKVEVEKSR